MGVVVRTGGLLGLEGYAVHVEVDLTRGLPGFHLVGLPNTAVRESRERVLAAIRNSGFALPSGKVTVNLAPADIRKEGASHDLAIAVAVIAAERARHGDEPKRSGSGMLVGELSLFGEVRPVRGLLGIVMDAAARGDQRVVVPAAQAWEARLVPGVEVVGVSSLREAVTWWRHGTIPAQGSVALGTTGARPLASVVGPATVELASQPLAARAAVLAVAGRHHLLLVGPPGAGKTRLARLTSALLPELSPEHGLEVTRIHSAAGMLAGPGLVRRPPLRAPHHTITVAGLIGGGARLVPGEVTLAHRGLLFLDELAEFAPAALDALREPLCEGTVRVSRGSGSRRYPAGFQLVAAMNPCRCGYLGSHVRSCNCPPGVLARYRSRVSGPLLDRFDLCVEVGDGRPARLAAESRQSAGENLTSLAESLDRARGLLDGRRDPPQGWALSRRVHAYGLDRQALACLERARGPLGLSSRGILRCCRVARTAAALEGTLTVQVRHVREALQFRWVSEQPPPG